MKISEDEIRCIVKELREHQPKSVLWRVLLHKLICAIQHSNKVTGQAPEVSDDDYNWALCQTWLDVSANIDRYDGADVISWVNMLLERRLMEAIDRQSNS